MKSGKCSRRRNSRKDVKTSEDYDAKSSEDNDAKPSEDNDVKSSEDDDLKSDVFIDRRSDSDLKSKVKGDDFDEAIFCNVPSHQIPSMIIPEQTIESRPDLQNIPSEQKFESRNVEPTKTDFGNYLRVNPGRGFETKEDLKVLELVTKEIFKLLSLKIDQQPVQDRWINPHLISLEF